MQCLKQRRVPIILALCVVAFRRAKQVVVSMCCIDWEHENNKQNVVHVHVGCMGRDKDAGLPVSSGWDWHRQKESQETQKTTTNRHLLAVPRFRLNTYGRRAFFGRNVAKKVRNQNNIFLLIYCVFAARRKCNACV